MQKEANPGNNHIMTVGAFLFDDFETLDVFGPVEILGRLKDHYRVSFYSAEGGLVNNSHGISIVTNPLDSISKGVDIFLIPGGHGTRAVVENDVLISKIREVSVQSKWILTVCTGSAIVAKTGLLDNRKATSNKRAFDWVTQFGPHVNWLRKSRWTTDDKFYTASGVSAGMDMTLGFLSDRHGLEFAKTVAYQIEFTWTEDKDDDNFYKQ